MALALTKIDYYWLTALCVVMGIGIVIDKWINRQHPKFGDNQRDNWALTIAMFALAGSVLILMTTLTKGMFKHNQNIDLQIETINHQIKTTQQQIVVDQTQAYRAKDDKKMYQYLDQKFRNQQKIKTYQN